MTTTGEYKINIVTYFDILGFKEMVRTLTSAEISRTLAVFRESARDDIEEEKEFLRGYTNFSDLNVRSIVVSSVDFLKVQPALLDYEIESIARIQCKLIEEHEIVVAGGVAVGPLVDDGNLIFGQGLIDAYELEQKAIFPRILVDPVLAEVAYSNAEEKGYTLAKQLIAKDGEFFYVDYLRAALNTRDENELLALVGAHFDLVSARLERYKDNARVRRKYEWLRKYHNEFVDTVLPYGEPKIPR